MDARTFSHLLDSTPRAPKLKGLGDYLLEQARFGDRFL
jgi:hypothetical protein